MAKNGFVKKKYANSHQDKMSVIKDMEFEETKMSRIGSLIFTYLWMYKVRTNLIKNQVKESTDKNISDQWCHIRFIFSEFMWHRQYRSQTEDEQFWDYLSC